MSLQQYENEATGILIDNAEKHCRIGNYQHAVELLESCTSASEASSSASWLGLVFAATARNKLHLHDDQGALSCLAKIPQDLLRANPKIAAERHTIAGILERRGSYRAWKAGDLNGALLKADTSIHSFQLAEQISLLGLEDRLRYNAVLNRVYAQGLRLAIQNRTTAESNGALVCEAMIAEAKSRDYTPKIFQNHLTGLTVIADLAIGADIELGKISSLSSESEYQTACRKIIGLQERHFWADLLLHEVKYASNVNPETLSRALILGSKSLLTDGRRNVDSLLSSYALHLRVCHMGLKQSKTNGTTMAEIEKTFLKFPKEVQQMARRTCFK